MTYYDELGVSSDASEEEIRKSFRQVSKMLHPDVQPERATRRLAEEQLRRLRDAVDTLCDRHARAEYNASLGRSKPASRVEPRQGLLLSLCLMAALGTGAWLWWLAPDQARLVPALVQEEPVIFSAPGSR